MSAVPHADSYDLVVKLTGWQKPDESHWYWQGQPMTEMVAMHRRIKRAKKEFGERLLGWRIVKVSLNQNTGELVTTIEGQE